MNSQLHLVNVAPLIQDPQQALHSVCGSLLEQSGDKSQMESWGNLVNSLEEEEIDNIFQAFCGQLQLRLASNASMPLNNTQSQPDEQSVPSTKSCPPCGDSGPECQSSQPSEDDYSKVFWAHTKQNGTTRFWAPRYTTFSPDNIMEKARTPHMDNVAAFARISGQKCSAVDLYAGTGYFAFGYLAAGVEKVLCWNLNPWSIEGLRRGALDDEWKIQVSYGDKLPPEGEVIYIAEDTRLVAFVESNERASKRVERIRDTIPPIRHVNCGLLPTSQGGYGTAATVLDPNLGGWIHVHESVALDEIDSKAEEVRSTFQKLINRLDYERTFATGGDTEVRVLAVEHVQRIESYTPGVSHCIVDIRVPPIPA